MSSSRRPRHVNYTYLRFPMPPRDSVFYTVLPSLTLVAALLWTSTEPDGHLSCASAAPDGPPLACITWPDGPSCLPHDEPADFLSGARIQFFSCARMSPLVCPNTFSCALSCALDGHVPFLGASLHGHAPRMCRMVDEHGPLAATADANAPPCRPKG